MLTFASEHQGKLCNFYPHLSLETVFPALKLTLCSINVNIFFLKDWQFNNGSPSPTHMSSLKGYPHNLTKYEMGNSKVPIFHLFRELRKTEKSN